MISANSKILIVDDMNVMRRTVANFCKKLGYSNLEVAESGAKAWIQLKSSKFDLIISDWNMPDMSGIQLLKKVRADDALKLIPFIMITAESEKHNIVEAVRSGVSAYIMKPFTFETLQEKISRLGETAA